MKTRPCSSPPHQYAVRCRTDRCTVQHPLNTTAYQWSYRIHISTRSPACSTSNGSDEIPRPLIVLPCGPSRLSLPIHVLCPPRRPSLPCSAWRSGERGRDVDAQARSPSFMKTLGVSRLCQRGCAQVAPPSYSAHFRLRLLALVPKERFAVVLLRAMAAHRARTRTGRERHDSQPGTRDSG
ncbi:hypothetical protein OH76DRAFT_1190369 [Lentinus brumalis]|uniref:Uncharacterized protein n=1 Tax=Lentinus brumalis TaxID=2498619 RepID=A0A371CTK0_9APHY|nr:hypothetical protein OH76DRAFT_1190369 [Polyporus brumalis]